MELHLKIAGLLLIFLSSIHIAFPKYFNWNKEFVSVSLVNRQMMYFHTFFLALALFLIGILCCTSSMELQKTVLGKRLTLGLGLFWGIRLMIQFFGYSTSLWKGKTFETSIHVLFSILWTYFSVVFLTTYFYEV